MERMRKEDEELMQDLPMERGLLMGFAPLSQNSKPMKQDLQVVQHRDHPLRQQELVMRDVEPTALVSPSWAGNQPQNPHAVRLCSFLVCNLLNLSCSLI
jgi:hypothetical protein